MYDFKKAALGHVEMLIPNSENLEGGGGSKGG